MDHKKIFTHPKKYFIVGTVGDFLPSQIDTPETWDALENIVTEARAWSTIQGLEYNTIGFSYEAPFKHYERVFDKGGRTFIVTKNIRIMIWRSETSKRWGAVHLGDYAGIGSGGMFATGLLKGGLPLNDIWNPLHSLDPLSSVEHTSIPLSTLKLWRLFK